MIVRKRQQGITKLADALAFSQDGLVRTETWVGPYSQLLTKFHASLAHCTTASLTPDEADTGVLRLSFEANVSAPTQQPPIIELEWVELRRPLETAPPFANLTAQQIQQARAFAEGQSDTPPSGTAGQLAERLAKGQTDYVIAVPVVRRTTFRITSYQGTGAWFRQSPPISISGWQWLKTADSYVRQGKSAKRVEEWTGAKEWDTLTYP